MNDSQGAPARRTRSTKTRVVIIGGVVPIIIGLVATILMFGWLPELPDPIAVHWSAAGADGFGPAFPFVILPVVITLIFSGFAVTWSWRSLPSGRLSWNQKVVLVTSVWMAVLLSTGIGVSVALQRGLSDAHDAPNITPLLTLVAGISVTLAVAAWFLLPAGESVNEPGTEPSLVGVRGEERIAWSHSAGISTTPLIIIALVLLMGVATVVVSALGSPDSTVPSVVVVVVVAALAVTNFWWRVSVDRRGFIVKGLLGLPRKRIRVEDVRSVTVVDVHPTRDFGGWGWRWAADGRSGIILRPGSGIEVTQSSGKRFIVTVDDAKTGAGALAALLTQRARS